MGFGPAAGLYAFRVDGRRFHLDVPEDGRPILAAAAEGNYVPLVPGCVVEAEFHERMDDDDDVLDMTACAYIVWDIAEDVLGVPWWTACRLAKSASVHWDSYAGFCLTSGHDPLQVRPAAWHLAMALAWLRQSQHDEKGFAKLERDLFKVPAAVVKSRRPIRQRPKDAASANDFARQMNRLKGGG